jgi:hypothetical protein
MLVLATVHHNRLNTVPLCGNNIGKTAKRHNELCKSCLQPIIDDFVDHWNNDPMTSYLSGFFLSTRIPQIIADIMNIPPYAA